MRAVRHTENGIEVVDVERPGTDDGRVRVQVRAAGICGSDLHILTWGPLRVTLGHEISGHLDDGTPVAIWPLAPCGECDRCVAGEESQCRRVIARLYGLARDGGMAYELVVEEVCLVPLPDGLDVADAALVEPVACSLHALRRALLRGDERVAVVGAGAIGLAAAAVARWMGQTVDLAARHDAQRRAATRIGAGADPKGEYDVVVDAAGTDSAVASCFDLLRPGGTLVLVASYWEPVQFPQFFTMKEPVIVGSNMHGHDETGRDMDAAAQLLADMPEVAPALITHRFPLDRAADAFTAAADRAAGAIKVLLEP
ncbi:MAG TPA: alcohol dehydrogenase catalytic domain-containing protein [Acidimicrobiia bacterium]|nr:alcohol dehydrogenase catalytic domain-containing protein [Acidimicrobiia bacterium]